MQAFVHQEIVRNIADGQRRAIKQAGTACLMAGLVEEARYC